MLNKKIGPTQNGLKFNFDHVPPKTNIFGNKPPG